MASNLPANYLIQNASANKLLSVVVQIAGLPDLLASTPIFKIARYGDPGLYYGEPGLVYGGLILVPGVHDILDLNGSTISISQIVEPEQGRGSTSQMNLCFIDKNQYMSQVVAPGVLIPDIMGTEVNVFLGYQQLSYPEDYYRIYRGYVTSVETQAGMVTLTVSDPNVKRRQNIFTNADLTQTLASPLDSVMTTVTLTSTTNLFQQIQGPDGSYDPGVQTFITIDSETMSYDHAGIISSTQVVVTRGVRGTTAAAHTSGTDVHIAVDVQDNAVTLALKFMLSGFDGPWISGQTITALGTLNIGLPGIIPRALLLPPFIDANLQYGLTIGDWVTITGSTMGNNGTFQILDFGALNGMSNNFILLSGASFTPEYPTSAVAAFRSQYDTLPVDCGAAMIPPDVDVARHQFLLQTFLFGVENTFDFFITASSTAKDFIETSIYLPMGAYSVTRQGRCSMGINQPPLAIDSLIVLNADNVKNPDQIKQARATNPARKFWNDILFNYDFDDSGNATNVFEDFDATSFNLIGIRQQLPIDAPGARTAFGAATFFARRASLMLTRFSRAATQITLKTNWGTGSQIEGGDIVGLQDNGGLQITNFATGVRDNGFQLYEVISRTLDVKSGDCTLTLISGIQSKAGDHYGVIAPSSFVVSGSTTSQINIGDSFGFPDPGDEVAKWTAYIGCNIQIHNPNFTTVYTTVLTGIDTVNGRYLTVQPAVSSPPTAGMIVDFDSYNSNPTLDVQEKVINCFLSHDAPIVSGSSSTVFTVSSGDLPAIEVGYPCVVHSTDYSVISPEVNVTFISGTTITVSPSLGFTPVSGQFASFLGFPDGRSCYRFI